MNKNKRFILVYNSYITKVGGASKILTDVISSLKDEFDFEMIATYEFDETDYHSNFSSDFDCPTESFKLHVSKRIPNYLTFFWKLPYCFLRYIATVRKKNPDIVLSFSGIEILIVLLGSIFNRNTKTVISFRSSPVSSYYTIGMRVFYRVLTSLSKCFANLIIVNSNDVKRILVDVFGVDERKISVIYNPKDIVAIQKQASEDVSENFFKTNVPILITVGRLVDQKGHWHLLRVFSQILETTPARLVICGDGPLDNYLKDLSKELGIKDSVLFLGWCENPHKYVSKSTVFVLSSLFEGLPNALIEAIICGCPAVSSDCKTGPSEILDNGMYGLLTMDLDGIKYDANVQLSESEQDLYEKIMLLLNDTELLDTFSLLSKERALYFEKERRMREYAIAFNNVCRK